MPCQSLLGTDISAFNMQGTRDNGYSQWACRFLIYYHQITCEESLTLNMLVVLVVLALRFIFGRNTFVGIISSEPTKLSILDYIQVANIVVINEYISSAGLLNTLISCPSPTLEQDPREYDISQETETSGIHFAEGRCFSLKLCSHPAVTRRSRRQFTCV